jgi:single-stranded-DNA-specific exonuclease
MKEWIQKELDSDIVENIMSEYGLDSATASILATRNFEDIMAPKTIKSVIDPYELKDIKLASETIVKHIKNKSKILIHGDYDADGATSSAIISRFLKKFNTEHMCWVPNRFIDGYGLSEGSYNAVKEYGADLMITVDCGTSDHGWAAKIENELDCEVVVTDHHLSLEGLPSCRAVVNPNRPDCNYPNKDLCGVGVAWKICWATLRELLGGDKDKGMELLYSLLPLVAVGTVADCVALNKENRALVYMGLARIDNCNILGLKELIKHLGIKIVNATAVGWKIGPVLNASGRMKSATINVELLTTDNPIDAKRIVSKAVEYNSERKEMSMYATDFSVQFVERHGLYKKPGIVVCGRDLHEGVVGIAAGRIAERYARPTLVLTKTADGIYKGSMRSSQGIDISKVIDRARNEGVILGGGGHKAAGGVTIKKDRIVDFYFIFNVEVISQRSDLLGPYIEYDFDATTDDVVDITRAFDILSPFGQGNQTPILRLDGIKFTQVCKIGREQDHMKGSVESPGCRSIDFVLWRYKEYGVEMNKNSTYDIVAEPEWNDYGRGSWQLNIKDIK